MTQSNFRNNKTRCLIAVKQIQGSTMDARKLDIRPLVDSSRRYKDLGADVFYEGKKCRVKRYRGPLARRANALRLIIDDLKACQSYLEACNGNFSTTQHALHRALVITYGKCFASGKNRGLSLDDSKVFAGSNEALEELHHLMITMRNGYVAHSDHDDWDYGEVSVVSPPDGMEDLDSCVLTVSQKFGCFSKEMVTKITPLLAHVRSYAESELHNCSQRILNDA